MKPHHSNQASIGRILKYTGLFGGVQGFYALMAMVRNKITALLLKTGGMGQIDNFSRTTDLIASGTNMGLAFSAVPHIARLESERNTVAIRHYVKLVRSWVFLTALLGLSVTAFAAPLWSRLLWGDGSHTFDFVLLAPLVFFSTLCGGEAAVLKGLHRLKKLATVSALGAVTTLVATLSCYWSWGVEGIVPALVLSAAALCGMHWLAAHRSIRYEIAPMNWRFLRRGRRMIRLGLAYAIAGFVAAGGEYLVRLILLHCDAPGLHHGNDTVGIYAAAFTLTVTYARLIFMSMDADYFPRLSAATADTTLQNMTVNRQIDVLVQLTAPLLPLFCLLSPTVVRMLYSCDFSAAVSMIEAAAPYLLFKAICTPIAYLGLAHSSSDSICWSSPAMPWPSSPPWLCAIRSSACRAPGWHSPSVMWSTFLWSCSPIDATSVFIWLRHAQTLPSPTLHSADCRARPANGTHLGTLDRGIGGYHRVVSFLHPILGKTHSYFQTFSSFFYGKIIAVFPFHSFPSLQRSVRALSCTLFHCILSLLNDSKTRIVIHFTQAFT